MGRAYCFKSIGLTPELKGRHTPHGYLMIIRVSFQVDNIKLGPAQSKMEAKKVGMLAYIDLRGSITTQDDLSISNASRIPYLQ